MKRFTIIAALTTFILGLASPVAAEQNGGDETKEVTVTATDYDFNPKKIEMSAGTTLKLKLVNEGNVSHSWSVPKLDTKSDRIQPGKSTTVTLNPSEAGTYSIECQVPGHKDIGMVGELVVSE